MIVRTSAAASLDTVSISSESGRLDSHALLIVVAFRAYTVKQLASGAQVEAEVKVMCGLTDCK